MATIVFKDGQILFEGGAVAMGTGCCCGCDTCTGCGTNPTPCTIEVTLSGITNCDCDGATDFIQGPPCGYGGTSVNFGFRLLTDVNGVYNVPLVATAAGGNCTYRLDMEDAVTVRFFAEGGTGSNYARCFTPLCEITGPLRVGVNVNNGVYNARVTYTGTQWTGDANHVFNRGNGPTTSGTGCVEVTGGTNQQTTCSGVVLGTGGTIDVTGIF